MKVVSFNIRCDYDQDGENSFRYRKSFILEKINERKPEVIAFQEVLPHVAMWLKENLRDYYVLGCGRDENLRDEQVSIAYRKDLFNLIRMDNFWLSPTPHIPGSRYPDQSICPRICTKLTLEELATQRIFSIYNVHLDHIGKISRKLSLEQILEDSLKYRMDKKEGLIILGDFNIESEEILSIGLPREYELITKEIGITYHGYGEDEPESIDHIVINDSLVCQHIQKWEDKKEGLFLSDHFPVEIELEWK